MAENTVVIERCEAKIPNEEVIAKMVDMLSKLPGIVERLKQAKRIFIKLNLGIKGCQTYKNRPIAYTDPAVFEGVAEFLQGKTQAKVLVGDGTDSMAPADAARERGHMAVVDKMGYQFVDLHQPPFARFHIPQPAMFRWYDLSAALQDVDLMISIAKMKSHHLCGVTLTMKNLFGLPPGPIYGSPRFATLHSAIRLPRILADLNMLFKHEICVIDGIVGANYSEWGGDPVNSGILIAGDNPVATDATGARFMGVDPQAARGTPPFLRADNHIQLASDLGLGPVKHTDINLIGEMPSERKPFTVSGASELETFAIAEGGRSEVCRLAQQYFEDRDRYVREYVDQVVIIGKDKVLLHAPIGEISPQAIIKVLGGDQFKQFMFYEVFAKLVQAEEAELSTPYSS